MSYNNDQSGIIQNVRFFNLMNTTARFSTCGSLKTKAPTSRVGARCSVGGPIRMKIYLAAGAAAGASVMPSSFFTAGATSVSVASSK